VARKGNCSVTSTRTENLVTTSVVRLVNEKITSTRLRWIWDSTWLVRRRSPISDSALRQQLHRCVRCCGGRVRRCVRCRGARNRAVQPSNVGDLSDPGLWRQCWDLFSRVPSLQR
jgi:hypothetical protein